jgi:hypothetical protein
MRAFRAAGFALQGQGLFDSRQMSKIFWPSDHLLAAIDALQRQHWHGTTHPPEQSYFLVLGFETVQSNDFAIDKIDRDVIRQNNDVFATISAPSLRARLSKRIYCLGGRSIQRSISNVVAGVPCRIAAVIPMTINRVFSARRASISRVIEGSSCASAIFHPALRPDCARKGISHPRSSHEHGEVS